MATKTQVINAVREALADQGVGDFNDETLFSWIGRTTSVKKATKKVAAALAEENAGEADAQAADEAGAFRDDDAKLDAEAEADILAAEHEADDEVVEEEAEAIEAQTKAMMEDDEARIKDLMEGDEALTREEAEAVVLRADDEEPKKEVGVVPNRYKAIYRANGDATCCGDEMSQLLKAATTVTGPKGKSYCDMAELETVAEANGLGDRLAKYRVTLNPGMCRMNIGNLLRGMVSREELVTIGNHVFNYVEDDENEGDGIESPSA